MKPKTRILVLLSLATLPILLFSQATQIRGKVVDKNSRLGLESVKVYCYELKRSVDTDTNGVFTFDISRLGFPNDMNFRFDIIPGATYLTVSNFVSQPVFASPVELHVKDNTKYSYFGSIDSLGHFLAGVEVSYLCSCTPSAVQSLHNGNYYIELDENLNNADEITLTFKKEGFHDQRKTIRNFHEQRNEPQNISMEPRKKAGTGLWPAHFIPGLHPYLKGKELDQKGTKIRGIVVFIVDAGLWGTALYFDKKRRDAIDNYKSETCCYETALEFYNDAKDYQKKVILFSVAALLVKATDFIPVSPSRDRHSNLELAPGNGGLSLSYKKKF